MMHKLLERQVRRALGDAGLAPGAHPAVEALLREVDATYRAADEDRRLLERSMDLASGELFEANQRLQQHQREQQVIFDSVPAMIIYKDTENRILHLNAPAARALGRSVQDLEGASTYDLFPFEVARKLHEDDLATIRSRSPRLGIIESHPAADGSARWLRTDKFPHLDAAGNVLGVIVFSTDITEERRGAEALRESEEKHRLIVETSTEGIWSLDMEGRTTFANQVMASMLGTTRERLMGRSALEFVLEEDLDEGRRKLAALLAGSAIRLDWRFRRDDGTIVWVQASAAPVRADDGRQVGILGMVTDISERRRAEEELRAAYAALQSVDQARAQFLNAAAHELGTPLTPLVLQLHIVRERFTPLMSTEQRRSLDILQRSVDRLSRLVADLLDAARLQTDHLKIEPARTDLAVLADQAAEAFRDVAREAQVTLKLRCSEAPVVGDPSRLAQVMDNLIANAIKFTGPGGMVEVEVRRDRDQARLVVRDDGIGLPPDALPRLFQPFSQVHDTMQVNKPGTGLGLYICKGIVDQAGGRITASSPGPGLGCTFTVTLPLAPGTPNPEVGRRGSSHPPEAGEAVAARLGASHPPATRPPGRPVRQREKS